MNMTENKKIMYITDTPLSARSGGGMIGKMHYMMVNELFSECVNVFITSEINEDKGKEIYNFPVSSKVEKIVTMVNGYPAYLSINNCKKILEIIKERKIGIVYIDNSITGHLAKKIKRIFPDIIIIAFFHDIEKILMSQQMKGKNLFRKWSLLTMIKNEKETVKFVDKTIVLNHRDELCFKENYGRNPSAIVPICVPTIKEVNSEGCHLAEEELSLLFVGVDYKPNVEGIRWFIKEVIPLLELRAKFRLVIVGYNLEKYRSEFESYSNLISVLGTVDNLRQYYETADVVIAPIADGGGMKVKTAEAFSYGKKFVGLEESLVGYWEFVPDSLKNVEIFRCTSKEEFADAIVGLYKKEYNRCYDVIINWMRKEFSYDVNKNRYKQLFEEENDGNQ